MTKYEHLLVEAFKCGAIVIELFLGTDKPCGKCIGNVIIINSVISTEEKIGVLSEELGHYLTTTGDITNQSMISNRKRELKARAWGYNKSIGLIGLVNAFEYGCRHLQDFLEYLNVSEEYFCEAIDYYKSKYGFSTQINDYTITFIPYFHIGKLVS